MPSQEYEIDKTLDIRGPDDVAKMGIDKYNAECRKIVSRYAGEWEACVGRMGRWIGKLGRRPPGPPQSAAAAADRLIVCSGADLIRQVLHMLELSANIVSSLVLKVLMSFDLTL